jgi:hypothetical protein
MEAAQIEASFVASTGDAFNAAIGGVRRSQPKQIQG